jgi:GT2 family glycosyltransferase
MRVLVGIATAGRRETLNETLLELARQSRLPDHVMLCAPVQADIDTGALTSLPFPTTVICGERGGSVQRNAILRQAADFDAVIFFDDDFFPEPGYIANAEELLQRHPEIVLATGHLLEDGIHGPGLTPDYARQKLASAVVPPLDQCPMIAYYGVYGCNMLVRLAPVREHALFFDEALPLYSWQEDIDFSRQLAPYGEIVRSDALTGVHLGAKRSRVSGVKFGYSQVANPIYLIRKGTMSVRFGMRTMVRNLLANAVRQFRSEPHIDRAGRCKGNILALADLVRGRLRPQRILELD